jgi:Cu/Ag efflux protein CusF
MMKLKSTLLLLGAAAALAACGETAPNAAAPAAEKSTAMPAAAVSGRGTGTVTAVDKIAGKVTIDHGPIPEANWGAMTMGFEAEPAMLETVTVGDKVEFGMTMSGSTAKVTSITRK